MVEQVVGVTQVGAGRTAGALTPPSNKLICLIQCKICTHILNIDMLVIGAKSKFVLKEKTNHGRRKQLSVKFKILQFKTTGTIFLTISIQMCRGSGSAEINYINTKAVWSWVWEKDISRPPVIPRQNEATLLHWILHSCGSHLVYMIPD